MKGPFVAATAIAFCAVLNPAFPLSPLTIEIKDYVALPITGSVDGTGQTDGMLARVNTVREEPGGARRLFINDLNGPLYIVDKQTNKLTTYLNFNGRDANTGMFHRLIYEAGYGNGFAHFQFDPDYARNGRFYTVHIENPAITASDLPDSSHVPGLNVSNYTVTPAIATPGPVLHEAVLIEWTDTNIANTTFEGTARELMRVQLNTRIHPMGEISFNPAARRGDPEWRVAYIGCGDSGSGEARGEMRQNPQRLDTLVGKILRIIPDLTEHADSSSVSENGRYRIPNDNPFVTTMGAQKEIWAYGFRNPHRLSWAVESGGAANSRLIATSIGLHTWETVNIVHKGANYGYSLREGNELLKLDNTTAPLPEVDKIPVQVGSTITDQVVVPTYPVAQYGHTFDGGDAIGSGYVYSGKAVPALRGKFIFSDLSTGRIWYAEYKDLLAADDGNPKTMAPLHEVKVSWNGRVYDSMFPITEAAYHERGGKDPDLPGRGTVSGAGRADARMSLDASGEIFIYSKTDGIVRQIVGAR
jgi:Glucose / Sorbosone dehydrogenase